MLLDIAIYGFAGAAGLVTAGLSGSAARLLTGEIPQLDDLSRPSRVLLLVLYAPLLMVNSGVACWRRHPELSVLSFGMAAGWSLLEGVFILTQVFQLD
jgi:hypothetical protein